MGQPLPTGVIRFGPFAIEPQAGILKKGDTRIRLQDQPFQVLLALLEKPGEVVTREELQQRVWSGEAFGDLDHRLNIAVNKVREALRDSADAPRYLETLPRRGYRFVGAVEMPTPVEVAPPPHEVREEPPRRRPWWIWIAVGLPAVAMVAGFGIWFAWPSRPPELVVRRLTNDTLPKSVPVLSDGTRLYYMSSSGGESHLVQVPISGGDPSTLPVSLPSRRFVLLDISPDGERILFRTTDQVCDPATCPGTPIWAVRIADGSSRRLGNLVGRWAAYSPDGGRVAVTSGATAKRSTVSIASLDGVIQQQLVTVEGLEVVAPVWSPEGRQIAMAQRKRSSQETSVWVVRSDGGAPRRLLPEWRQNHFAVGWTPDGQHVVVKSDHKLWSVPAPSRWPRLGGTATQLTPEEPELYAPILPRGQRINYAVGISPLGELQRLDVHSKAWVPHMGGISADGLEYSRDGRLVAYTTFPKGELWVRHADGSQPVQMTNAPMTAFLPRWSPDGRVIAFMGRSNPEDPWRIFLVDAAGGPPRLACPGNSGPEGDLAWTPDGKFIVYAIPNHVFYTGETPYLRLLDLSTCKVSIMPGSDRLISPRWSPEGSTLVAFRLYGAPEGPAMMLYHADTGNWEKVTYPNSLDWPSWSHDGKSVWYYTSKAIFRYDLQTHKHVEVAPMTDVPIAGNYIYSWFALTPQDEPMILRRRDIAQIYALEWKAR